jgi:hypothetical protein
MLSIALLSTAEHTSGGSGTMAQLEPDALRAVEGALARYIAEVEGAGLKPSTAHTYIHHARAFVRWLKGGFAPGATLPREGPRGAPSRPPA